MNKRAWVIGVLLFLLGGLSQYVGGVVSWIGTLLAVFGLGIIFADLIDNAIQSPRP